MEFKKQAAAKVAAVATTLAMASSVLSFAPFVHAQTTTTTTTTTTASATCSVGMVDLTVGSTGPAVVCLQNALVAGGYLVMPAGVAPGYFGALTKAAVSKWQTAKGIMPAAGYFGPISRAAFAPVAGGPVSTTPGCMPGAAFSSTTGAPCVAGTPGTPSTPGGPLQGGAGDITVTERSSGVQDEVLEGEEEIAVLGFEIEAEGSDVKVTSVKVELEHTDASGSDRLDRYVDEVLVMQGDKVVGSANADDFSENSDVYSRSISLSGAVVEEDETERFYIAVTAVNNVDSNDLGTEWTATLEQTRFEDAEGAILTDTTGSIEEVFTFEDLSTAGDVELTINEDDDEINDAHTVMVDDSSDTNDVEVLSFTLDADGSDISLNELTLDVTSSGSGVTEIANDFRLMMGDEEIGSVSFDLNQDNTGGDSSASTTDTAIALIFEDLDDDDVVIEDGDEVSFTLVADINDIDGTFGAGDSLSVSLASADVDAEDENGDDADVSGSASSDTISFQSTGINVEVVSSSADPVLNLDSTSTDDQGKYEVTFDVTAFEDTAYISLTAASSTSANTDNVGIAFGMENASSGASVQTGTTSSMTLSRVSGGTVTGNYVRINAGQTARFTLTTYYDAATTGSYRVQLDSVGFNQSSAAAPDQEKDVVPAADFESEAVQVLN